MEITVEMILMVSTAIVTAIMGFLAKKFNWDTKDYIPFQNLTIGLFMGILMCLTGTVENLLNAILIGIFSALTAGGAYDLLKMNKEE
jgi:hypothetical protein